MTTANSTRIDAQLVAEVADFLYLEARLLDTRELDAWLELYADDATYAVPIEAQSDPVHRVSIMFEDKRRLTERVLRLNSGFAYSQEPASRTAHLIGNVRVVGEADGLLDVTAVMVLTEARRGRQNVYSGEVVYRLRRVDGGYLIVAKEIRLVNSDLPLGNLTFLL